MTGGVSLEHVVWVPFDGLGFTRVGLNFTEKGFGIRPPLGVSDRANSAASKLAAGDVDWTGLLGEERVRWLHTGGIFAGLSDSCAELALEGMEHARRGGNDRLVRRQPPSVPVGYCRPRPGRRQPATCSNTSMSYSGALRTIGPASGSTLRNVRSRRGSRSRADSRTLSQAVLDEFPQIRLVAMTLRDSRSAGFNHWGGLVYAEGSVHTARFHRNLEIYDRVGGGDGFVSGVMWSILDGRSPSEAVEIGVAHGALTMTTPGDTSMVTQGEVLRAVTATDARADR